MDNESPASYPPLGFFGANLKVLAWQTQLGMGLNLSHPVQF
jgi:hypothetical protein